MPNAGIIALYRFFGLKDGQTRAEFAAEVNALDDDDKHELIVLANAEAPANA